MGDRGDGSDRLRDKPFGQSVFRRYVKWDAVIKKGIFNFGL